MLSNSNLEVDVILLLWKHRCAFIGHHPSMQIMYHSAELTVQGNRKRNPLFFTFVPEDLLLAERAKRTDIHKGIWA